MALWLDIDQDSRVDSTDLVLDLVTLVGVMQVEAAGLIFSDGFETGDSSRWSDSLP